MKKSKFLITSLVFLGIILTISPPTISQIGTYEFHGAAGNQKILKVRTVDNASLADLFGPADWVNVIEIFGEGAANVGARKKSVVTAVNTSFTYFGYDATNYTTDNWDWTLGGFSATPDDIGFEVYGLYNPVELTAVINLVWTMNVTVQNAALLFAQLPTPVAQYLGAIVWEPKWENIDNTVVHNAEMGDTIFLAGYQYLEDCTETWTYDETFGAWISYKIQDNESNTIYEFSIDLTTAAQIPGFELPIILSVSISLTVGLIYIIIKKKR
ncbi:MAG: hypothetical protein ACFFDB_03600 [Promethearchaeota archaeon]